MMKNILVAHLRGQKVPKLALFVVFILFTSFYIIYRQPNTLAEIYNNESTTNDMILMEEPNNCGCKKWIKTKPQENPNYTESNGTCSKLSYARGPGQKVVGFTFYEPTPEENAKGEDKTFRKFFEGILENYRLIQKMYGSSWTVRVYYQVDYKGGQNSTVMKQLCDLTCSESNLDLCDASENPRLGNATILYPLLWRFLPVLDVNVDLFLSRDLDSRISVREVAAVHEFIQSDYLMHVMRDHPAHAAYMMGGTWGAKVNQMRNRFLDAFKKLFKDAIAYVAREEGGGWDQIALVRYIWPWSKKVALSHDSYTCHKFARTSPFPTQRTAGVGNFIGSVVSLNSSIGLTGEGGICPDKCRPKDHKDWLYC